jgi:hypothetical protein
MDNDLIRWILGIVIGLFLIVILMFGMGWKFDGVEILGLSLKPPENTPLVLSDTPKIIAPSQEVVFPTIVPIESTESIVWPTIPEQTTKDDYVLIEQLMIDGQNARIYAHKTGDTSVLSEFYSGQALEKNISLINQYRLSDDCYLDIHPATYRKIDIIDDTSDGIARVVVEKTETRIRYCFGKINQTLTVYDETYSSEFTVEKINDRWYITVRP